jgi:AcrR family transcriptional regulator
MARQAGTQSINTTTQTSRKRSQRERLLHGVVTVANRDGYARANVSAVIAEAGVSRPTFYEYFADKDACFLAALADIQERLLEDVREAVKRQPPERAIQATIEALMGFAAEKPSMARFLMSESMAAGSRALDERDHGVAELERVVDEAYRQLSPSAVTPDVCVRVAIGGIYRLLAIRLRRGEPRLTAVLDDLLRWLDSYQQPVAQHRWRSLEPTATLARSAAQPDAPARAPIALAPGRPRLSQEQVAANHRRRILLAAARLAQRKGYTATTIAEINDLAGVDGRAFYGLFSDKQDAFMTMHELGFQRIMGVTASAFFAGASWPERSWDAVGAFMQFLERNPTGAHVAFIAAYAVGRGAIQRIEDSHVAFTIFLQQGYQHTPREDPPSRVALEAIMTTIFEIVYLQARASATPRLTGLLAHTVFLWLTPFTGPADANEFIDLRLQAARVSGHAATRYPG